MALVFITIFAAQLAPYEFDRGRVQDRMQGPSAAHLLGTDHVGRDFLSRLIIGARLSITVGLAATVLNLIVATASIAQLSPPSTASETGYPVSAASPLARRCTTRLR